MTGGQGREELLAQIREFMSEQRGIDSALVTEDARLDDDLGLDSLALTEIGFALFTNNGVLLDDDVILTARIVGDVLDVLTEQPGNSPSIVHGPATNIDI